ncbi:TonB-dependent receptor domain-containing protein [Photorhabdus asymbiotica]|uniref:TonB-dependent receptor domain-containing protein n=1 Tax=Photorhabdus asymbiotica TaxID=291112 RepID=UPI003DA776BD
MKKGIINRDKFISCLLITLPCYGYTASVQQENSNNYEDVKLGEIAVTAKRDKFDSEYLDRKKITRFRGTANGDIFSSVSGVQVNNIRNEAGAIDVGIRGMQGEGRVPVIIDGSLQVTHTFRGYQGESDRTYIDMDLVKSIQVEKGASQSKYATGAIGGLVEMRTLGAEDVILPGENFGILFKGSVYNNNRKPHVPADELGQQRYLMANGIKSNTFNNGSATTAIAYQNDSIDFIVAYSKRAVGNYFAGSKGIERYGEDATVSAGQEVVNTSYESDSGIAKVGLNLTDNQRLEVNFRRHVQKAGEVLSAYWNKAPHDTGDPWITFSWYAPDGVDSMPQWSLGSAIVNAYSASYSYVSEDSRLVDFNLGLWKTTAKLDQHNGYGLGKYGDQYKHKYSDDRKGINISNRSSLSLLPLTFDYGAILQEERMTPHSKHYSLRYDPEMRESVPWKEITPNARNGRRTERMAFLNTTLDYPLVTMTIGSKLHNAKVSDYYEQNHINYGTKADILGQFSLHVTKNIDLYAKASDTYRNPSLFESTTSSQTYNYDRHNPLRPENARSWEAGVAGEFNDVFTTNEKIDFKASYFDNRVKDFISAAQLPKNPGEPEWRSNFSFRNYDKVALKGIELAASYDNHSFFVDASAVFYRKPQICSRAEASKYGDSECNEIGYHWSLVSTRIPPERAFNLTVGKRFLNDDLTVGARLKYHSGKQNPKDWLQGTAARAVVAIPSEKIIDLFASYTVNPQLELTFNVDNLTNRYAFDPGTVIGMPIPGRTFRAGLEVKF